MALLATGGGGHPPTGLSGFACRWRCCPGRRGYARHGVSRSGAADDLALRVGNSLLGNDDNAAALEVSLGGLKLRAHQPCAIALTGADCGASLARAGEDAALSLSTNEVVLLRTDDELSLGYAKDGARAYVCVQGGVDVPAVLGSRATDVRARLGGHRGRALLPGDSLGRVDGGGEASLLRATHDPLRDVTPHGRIWELRVLPGPGNPGDGCEDVPAAELQALLDAEYDVLPRSDRMAVCLAAGDGPLEGGEQMSEACVSGTVQLPPDGNPLILLAEHQTTGGYKVPAVVIQADMWQVGQMRPGDKLRFVPSSTQEAVDALRSMRSKAQQAAPRPVSSNDLDLLSLNAGVNQMVSYQDLPQPAPAAAKPMSSATGSFALVRLLLVSYQDYHMLF